MNYSNKDKDKRTIKILIAVIAVLVLGLVVLFVLLPSFNNFVTDKQNEAANIVVNNIYVDMINQLQSTGVYKVQIGNDTLILEPRMPQQA